MENFPVTGRKSIKNGGRERRARGEVLLFANKNQKVFSYPISGF